MYCYITDALVICKMDTKLVTRAEDEHASLHILSLVNVNSVNPKKHSSGHIYY